jgi:hypothetical protein
VKPTIPAPAPQVDHSLIARLRTVRNGKLNDLVKLQGELSDLDSQISWLERFPQVEAILRSLMGK